MKFSSRAPFVFVFLVASCDTEPEREPPVSSAGKADSAKQNLARLDDMQTPIGEFGCKDALVDRSGRDFGLPKSLETDPIFKAVYADADNGCPVEFADVMAKLKKTDTEKCAKPALETRAISEEAMAFGKSSENTGYRTVTTRACGGRPKWQMLFVQFGYHGGKGPESVNGKAFVEPNEMISFDEKHGVFNYWKKLGNKMNYFGNSIDFITQGPEEPFLTAVRGCATCHTGGGLIMKELHFPWVHWNDKDVGREQLVENRKANFGTLNFGADLEEAVRAGNTRWNKTRIAFLKEHATTQELLKPLFCPVEVNVRTNSPPDKAKPTKIPSSIVLDEALGKTDLTFNPGEYDAIIDAFNQEVPDTAEQDTSNFPTIIERAGADDDYVSQLVSEGIVSAGFATAVRLVDFTRPVFSDERCKLLSEAPELKPADRTKKKILDGFVKNLKKASGAPAEQLLTSLESVTGAGTLNAKPVVEAFLAACEARRTSSEDASLIKLGDTDVRTVMLDLMKIRALQRKWVFGEIALPAIKTLKDFSLFEFPPSLAADEVSISAQAAAGDEGAISPKARLNPNTCELVKSFVAIKDPG